MAGDAEHPRRKSPSVEEWLAQKLAFGGDDDEGEDEGEDEGDDEAVREAALAAEPPAAASAAEEPIEEDPEPTQPDRPAAAPPPDPPSMRFEVPPWRWDEDVEVPSPPLPDPPPGGWERDTDPTPITWDTPLPEPAPGEPSPEEARATPGPTIVPAPPRQPAWDTTDTHPFAPLDEEPSDAPELSDPGPYVLADPPSDSVESEPEIEDLEPPRQGDFDEVFPGVRAPVVPAARDEETNALLRETDSGREPTRPDPPSELEEVGSDPREPGTQWLPHARPAPRAAEEKTEIRGFGPPGAKAFDPDELPTVIVPPPTPAPLAPSKPPSRPPVEAPPATIDDPRTTAVIAWTGSALGALMFFVVVLVGATLLLLQYVEL